MDLLEIIFRGHGMSHGIFNSTNLAVLTKVLCKLINIMQYCHWRGGIYEPWTQVRGFEIIARVLG